jgi:hypothetical protein
VPAAAGMILKKGFMITPAVFPFVLFKRLSTAELKQPLPVYR